MQAERSRRTPGCERRAQAAQGVFTEAPSFVRTHGPVSRATAPTSTTFPYFRSHTDAAPTPAPAATPMPRPHRPPQPHRSPPPHTPTPPPTPIRAHTGPRSHTDAAPTPAPAATPMPRPHRPRSYTDASHVPEAQSNLAQRFSAGSAQHKRRVPEGRPIHAKHEANSAASTRFTSSLYGTAAPRSGICCGKLSLPEERPRTRGGYDPWTADAFFRPQP